MIFVDLSHPISNSMFTYPSDPDVSIIKEKDIETDNTLLHSFSMGTHTGTHLDVPAHVIPYGKTVANFTLNSFMGTTVKVDDSTYNSLNQVEGEIDGVVYDFGWCKYFNNPKKYYGPDRPVIPLNFVEYAIKIGIKYFDCDLPSVDVCGSKNKPVHNNLLGANIIIYESLPNLDQLPILTPFQFYGFPLHFG